MESIATVARRVLAGIERRREEFQMGESPVAATTTRDNDGEVTHHGDVAKSGVAVGGGPGNAPQAEGRSVLRSGGRYSAHTELKFVIVGTPARAAGRPLQRPAQSLPAFFHA